MSDLPRTHFTLGHSPDPDDAFMFFAMAQNRIDLRGNTFEHILQDIQTLNERATRGELDISAISIHAYAHVLERYALLPCGASMGDGYGPMLITKSDTEVPADPIPWLGTQRIAVPGKMTSAYLALQLYLGEHFHVENTVVIPFDEIFAAVNDGRADVGLIIHEGQLTYAAEGFQLITDLGVWWKEDTGLPLPLGGNVIRKDIPVAKRKELSDILMESIRYGLSPEHRADGVAHSMPLARGMDTTLADKFIGMYVNDYTLDYSDKGRQAIREFLGRAHAAGIIPNLVDLEFVE